MSYKMCYHEWLKAKHWFLFDILDETRTTKMMASFVNRTGYAEICTCDYLAYRDLKKRMMYGVRTWVSSQTDEFVADEANWV